MQVPEPLVIGFSGLARICGPDNRFNPQGELYPRVAIALHELEMAGGVIFVHNLSGFKSLLLCTSDDVEIASIEGNLMADPNSPWGSLEIRGAGSIFLANSFVQERPQQERLTALVTALDTPVAIVREFQQGQDGEFFDGWSIILMNDDAVGAYVAAAKACPTGGPTRFEVLEVGNTSELLHRELTAWRGADACCFASPVVHVQRSQVLYISLQ